MEFVEKLKKVSHKKINLSVFIIIIVIFVVILTVMLMLLITTNIKNKENNYKNLDLQNQISDLQKNRDENLAKIEELSGEKKQIEIQNQINSLTDKKSNLINEKQNLENDIAKLKQDVIRVKGEPKNYPAGYLKAGSDFEAGKYKIYNGNSNFIVHSLSGNLKVNIILGNGKYSVNEYIYRFSSGDEIQADSSFTMVLVE